MKTTMNKYIYEYDKENLSVLCQIKLPIEKHFEVAKDLVIKKYGSFDKNKLVFKEEITTTGDFDGKNFVEGEK